MDFNGMLQGRTGKGSLRKSYWVTLRFLTEWDLFSHPFSHHQSPLKAPILEAQSSVEPQKETQWQSSDS